MWWAQRESSGHPGILEEITKWPEGNDFGISPEEEETHFGEVSPYTRLLGTEKWYTLLTDGSCYIVGKCQRWKPAVWSPTWWVAAVAKGMRTVCKSESRPTGFRCCWAGKVASAFSIQTLGWWQMLCGGGYSRGRKASSIIDVKPIWADELWWNIAAWVENLVVKVCYMDVHAPMSSATEECQKNHQMDQAVKTEMDSWIWTSN